MPRGDGLHNKVSANGVGPRRTRKRVDLPPQPPSKSLAARIQWWEDFGTNRDPYNNRVSPLGPTIKYTNYNQGIETFIRPGSQKK